MAKKHAKLPSMPKVIIIFCSFWIHYENSADPDNRLLKRSSMPIMDLHVSAKKGLAKLYKPSHMKVASINGG